MLSQTITRIIFISITLSLLTMLLSPLYAEDANGKPDQGFKSVVPDLSGMTLQEASNTLPKYDLSLGAVTNEISDVAPGTIISQSEAANSEVARWAVVHVSVARNSAALTPEDETTSITTVPMAETTAIPSLELSTPAADTTITENSSLPESTTSINDTTTTTEAALIPALTPAPEPVTADTTEATTTVTVPEILPDTSEPTPTPDLETTEASVVTEAPDQEFKSLVPSLKGLTVEKATTLLPQYDLLLGTVSEEESNAPAGTIISQSEQVDKEIPRGSLINVSIAMAKKEEVAAALTDTVIPVTPNDNSDKPKQATTTTVEIKEDTSTKIEEITIPLETAPTEVVKEPEEKAVNTEEVIATKEAAEKSEEKADTATQTNDLSTTKEKESEKPVVQEASKTPQDQKELSATQESATASRATGDYAAHKVRVSLAPEGHIQVTRDITMEMSIDPPFDKGQKLSYQFNISGKSYNSQKPVFTHVFDEEESIIVTASVRIPGKPWLHSSSKKVKVGAFKLMKIKVPDIVGLSEAKAAALLKSKGLKVGNTRDKIVKGGSGVIEQMPKAGSMRYENDNEIHYVRAVDEKFRVNVVLSKDGLETGKPVTLRASVNPKPRNKKVRYRFLVGDKAYNSKTHKWQHTFEDAGDIDVTAEAIINGEGTFVSAPKTFTIGHAWVKPKSVISPFTATVEQGEVINFESASSYDTNGVVELSWRDSEDNTDSGADFTVNTENLSEGEHWVSLRIKDKKGNIDVSRAQIIVTPKASEEKQADKQDEAAAKVADAESITQALEEAISDPQKADAEVNGEEILELKQTTPSLENGQEDIESGIVVSAEESVKSELPAPTTPLATSDASSEDTRNAEVTDSESKGFNWGILIWLTLIGIVLLPIFWILRKLTTKPKPTPAVPQNHVPANQNHNANQAKKSSSRVDPDLTDFELGAAAKAKSKKDDLTNFNLDDD